MGAVGALAPTVFESVGGSTHGFWQLLSKFHQFSKKDADNITEIMMCDLLLKIHE